MPRVRKTATLGFLASIALSALPAIAHAEPLTSKPVPASSAPAPGEKRYIVQYDDNVNAESKSAVLEEKGIEVKDTISHVLQASVVVATPQEIEAVKGTVGVVSVEVDQPVFIAGETSIWGIDRVDQRTGRDGQYAFNEGSGVTVYVADSGIYPNHSQFVGRVPTGWTGIHDGRGFQDCNGHGTHVAGTVAGTTYGVAKQATIIPLRVLECNGSGWSSTVVAAIDWAVSHHQPGQPAVMNMSIGGFTSASLQSSVQKAVDDGITVVAAAGNSNQDACQSAPGSIPVAITVAATDINDNMASFSNYGSCVDVQAPGVSIRSAYNNADTGYNTMSGTSMATPHVAGAAAIMLSRNRSLSPAQVHQRIIEEATVGVIHGNKGYTPNRMLFIPALAGPSCSNLQLGQAWAGVGLTCRAPGGAASDGTTSPAPATEIEGTEISTPFEPIIMDPEPMVPAPAVPEPVIPVSPEPVLSEPVKFSPAPIQAPALDKLAQEALVSIPVEPVEPVTTSGNPAPDTLVTSDTEPVPVALPEPSDPVTTNEEPQLTNAIENVEPTTAQANAPTVSSLDIVETTKDATITAETDMGSPNASSVVSFADATNLTILFSAGIALVLGLLAVISRLRRPHQN